MAIEKGIRLFSEPALRLMLLQAGTSCRVEPVSVAMRMEGELTA